MYLYRGSPDFFFNFHIRTTEVIPYNALNSEFANFETPCILLNSQLYQKFNDFDVSRTKSAGCNCAK
jgi:hypothetical protein